MTQPRSESHIRQESLNFGTEREREMLAVAPPRAAGKTTPARGSHTLPELDLDAFEEHTLLWRWRSHLICCAAAAAADSGRDSDEKEMALTRRRRI